MMDITNIYKNINIEIYNTPFKKKLPCRNYCKNLSSININSGLSYSNNIIIYRKEELLKVLIHEIIHILDIDVKYENYNANIADEISSILPFRVSKFSKYVYGMQVFY